MPQSTKGKKKKRRIIIPVVIILTVIAAIYLFHESHFQSTDDAYIEADIIQVTPKVSGHIIKSYIQDNMEIKKGDLVAIETLKGELVGAGNSLFSADEILASDSGFVVNVSKVFMKPGVYPKLWK